MSPDLLEITFYFILTTSGIFYVYKRIKNLTTERYIEINKIGECATRKEAKKAVLDAVNNEMTNKDTIVSGEL